MHGKLVPYGGGLALILDQAIIDQAQLTADMPVEVSVDEGVVKVQPLHEEAAPADIETALEKVNTRYPHTLKRLAE